jgi:D-3-phosphoglycerate dehydrogenase
MRVSTLNVFIADRLPAEAVALLEAEGGLTVVDRPGLAGAELLQAVAEADGLIVRSGVQVTAAVIAAAPRLKAVVRAGAGVDNIDVRAATKRGIVVMNTPGGNTLSTAELTFALLLALARHIPRAAASVAAGEWDRKSFTGTQLAGKTIGIVGFGRVGQAVAQRAAAFGMTVLAYDPYVSDRVFEKLGVARRTDLPSLLPDCDAVTLHTPMTADTRGLLGAKELALVRRTAFLVNSARGGLVDEAALAEALNAGRLAGAAVDVFSTEPPTGNPLLGARNLIATPHLGASTHEAQAQVALDAARQMADVLLRGDVRFAVNMPTLDRQTAPLLRPYADLALRLGAIAVQLFPGPCRRVELVYTGELTQHDVRPVTAGFLVGLLRPILAETVNQVSAPLLAAERGIVVDEVKSAAGADYANLLTARVETADGLHTLAGTIYGRNDPRLVNVDDCRLEARPAGEMLFISNEDRPGVIGVIGTVCGRHAVNIADMTVGRLAQGGTAMTVLNIDTPPSEAALDELRRAAGIRSLCRVTLPPRNGET